MARLTGQLSISLSAFLLSELLFIQANASHSSDPFQLAGAHVGMWRCLRPHLRRLRTDVCHKFGWSCALYVKISTSCSQRRRSTGAAANQLRGARWLGQSEVHKPATLAICLARPRTVPLNISSENLGTGRLPGSIKTG